MRTSAALLLALAVARPATAQVYVLDLSRQAAGSTLTLSGAVGSTATFQVINRRPNADYSYSVLDRIREIGAFDVPSGAALQGPATTCEALVTKALGLNAAETEAAVGNEVRAIRQALEAGTCEGNATALDEIQKELDKTVLFVPQVYTVRAGRDLVLTVSRADGDSTLIWTLVVEGGERGRWLTTFGVMFAPHRDETFFAEATDDQKFAIKKEIRRDQLKTVPSVFFTWIPRSQQNRSWAHGPTAGLGVHDDNAAVFVGYGTTYNWNLGLVGGVAAVREQRLQGRYTEGQIVSENLGAEQLNRHTTHVRWFVGATFRFGSNPFSQNDGGGNNEDAEEGGEGQEQ
jgi:hypothetical protein